MKKEITSLQHPIVKHLVKLRENSQFRHEHQSIVLEGSKPISEVLSHVKRVFHTAATPPFSSASIEYWQINEAILRKISGMDSPEGLVAEVEMPPNAALDNCSSLLVLDRISDPGNMGTLLRSALAFGWAGVYILDGSCDHYNEKVLRAARGTHFKLPVRKGSLDELQNLIKQHNYQVLTADLAGEAPENIQVSLKKALVLGNEAQGPSKELRNLGTMVSIPMKGEMESLNVAIAGGILMYLLNR